MQLSEWLNYIGTLHTSSIDLGLSRIQPLAERFKLNHFFCPVITVAGTNGKGSTVAFLSSILLAAGYRVAAYTSPHLIDFKERLLINGEMLNDAEWCEAFAWIEKNRVEQNLSFFEFTTLAALWLCQKKMLDVLILEVGLGGRLDAVNIVDPSVAVITKIALDHLDWLGDTREQIGFEKAGIFRKNIPVVCGDLDPPHSILNRAAELSAPIFIQGRDFSFSQNEKEWAWSMHLTNEDANFAGIELHGWPGDGSYRVSSEIASLLYAQLPIPQLQIINASTALMALACLQKKLPISESAIDVGIKNAHMPARLQWKTSPIPALFDVSHNPDAAALLAETFACKKKKFTGKTFAICSILKDKDRIGTLQPLIPLVDRWYVASLDLPRGSLAEDLEKDLLQLGVARAQCRTFKNVSEAAETVLKEYQPNDCVIVFGSFHTVAEVLAAWNLN